MWGNPEGPYPVSNKTGTSLPSPELLPICFNLSLKFLASTKGQEFDFSSRLGGTAIHSFCQQVDNACIKPPPRRRRGSIQGPEAP